MDLSSYDVIVINTSGGKDSQAMMDHVVRLANDAGVKDRIVAVHADLGRVEWEGTRELAQKQSEHYGLRFMTVARAQGDLLYQIEFQRKMFPDPERRFCTSDQKTGQVTTLITRLSTEVRKREGRTARVLNCLGLRAQESAQRAKKPVWSIERDNRNVYVDRWLPIHDWTEDQVWARIKESGVPHHPAYDKGMPRLSCSFCIFAPKEALVRAAQLRPALAAEYVRIELKLGHNLKKSLSMQEVVALAAITPTSNTPLEVWAA